MIPISKVVGVMSCSFFLCLGLSANAASAADEMNAGQAADRRGGQAGLGDKLEKEEGVAGQVADRRGGQAGLGDKLEKKEGVAGQAGPKRDQEKLEGVADK